MKRWWWVRGKGVLEISGLRNESFEKYSEMVEFWVFYVGYLRKMGILREREGLLIWREWRIEGISVY